MSKPCKCYGQAVACNPEYDVAWLGLVDCQRRLGMEEECKLSLVRVRELMANDSSYNLACLEAVAGNADEALFHLEQSAASGRLDKDWGQA